MPVLEEMAEGSYQNIPTRPNWGSINDFETILKNTFGDQNKKTNAENQLALLQQGTKTAEEYFQEFDQLV
jgi:Retrotransposon gag protein